MAKNESPGTVGAAAGAGARCEKEPAFCTTPAILPQDIAVGWLSRRYGLRDAVARVIAAEAGFRLGWAA